MAKVVWEVAWAGFSTSKLAQLLEEGWEPFSAEERTVWLRRVRAQSGECDAGQATEPAREQT